MEYKTILIQAEYEKVGLLGQEAVQALPDVDAEIARFTSAGWEFVQLSHSTAGAVLHTVVVFRRAGA